MHLSGLSWAALEQLHRTVPAARAQVDAERLRRELALRPAKKTVTGCCAQGVTRCNMDTSASH